MKDETFKVVVFMSGPEPDMTLHEVLAKYPSPRYSIKVVGLTALVLPNVLGRPLDDIQQQILFSARPPRLRYKR